MQESYLKKTGSGLETLKCILSGLRTCFFVVSDLDTHLNFSRLESNKSRCYLYSLIFKRNKLSIEAA